MGFNGIGGVAFVLEDPLMNSDIEKMTQKELLQEALELEKKLRDGEITPAEASRLSLIKSALRRIQEAGAK